MEFKIEQTGDVSGTLNIMLYGPPGAGKTRFIGSTYPKFKTLILSAEKGLLSLNQIKDANGKTVKFDQIKIESFEEIEGILKKVRLGDEQFKNYNCIAMDSGTEIQNICMESILRKEGRTKAQIQDWGTLGERMAAAVRGFRDSDVNFIMTALQDEQKDDSTGEMRVLPAFKGKFQQLVSGLFDLVFYSYVEHKKDAGGNGIYNHRLLTRNSGKFVAKDRSGLLATVIEPDFIKIHEKIYGGEQ